METYGRLLRDWLRAKHAELISDYERSKGYPTAVSGFERELLVERLLSQIMPPTTRYGSGVLVGPTGKSTGQLDIVLETKASISFPVTTGRQRLYLADTVAAVIEVKSDLRKQEKAAFRQLDGVLKITTESANTPLTADSCADAPMKWTPVPRYLVTYKGPTRKGLDRMVFRNCGNKRRQFPTGILCLKPAYFWGHGPPDQPSLDAEGEATALFAFLANLSMWLAERGQKQPDLMRYRELII